METLAKAVKAVDAYAKTIPEWFYEVSLKYCQNTMHGEPNIFFRAYVHGCGSAEDTTVSGLIEKLKEGYAAGQKQIAEQPLTENQTIPYIEDLPF